MPPKISSGHADSHALAGAEETGARYSTPTVVDCVELCRRMAEHKARMALQAPPQDDVEENAPPVDFKVHGDSSGARADMQLKDPTPGPNLKHVVASSANASPKS